MTRRSRRSHVVELALAAVAILAIWLFLVNGGPAWAGTWLGSLFAS